MNDDLNPYASHGAHNDAESKVHPIGDAEGIRVRLLKHEAEVRAVGMFLDGVAAAMAGGVAFAAIARVSSDRTLGVWWEEAIIPGGFLLLAALIARIGTGLRRFEPCSRLAGLAITGVGLLYPPTTLFCGWSLYVHWSRDVKIVFSPQYAAIRAATPEMKYRKWTVMGVLLVFMLALFAAALLIGLILFLMQAIGRRT